MPPTAYQQPRFVTWPVRNPRCLSNIFYFRFHLHQPGTSGQSTSEGTSYPPRIDTQVPQQLW